MSRKNILILLFLAAFIIPELLWFPVSSIFLSFFDIYHISRDTWLDNISPNAVSLIIAIETISILGLTTLLLRALKKRPLLILLAIVSSLVSIISLFVFFISISLRNIGF